MTFESLLQRRLTREEYLGLLGQEYHLSLAAPENLRRAAARVSDARLARWLEQHAADEDGHHLWALRDLADLGATPPAPTEATRRLLERVAQVAGGDEPHTILGLSVVVEHAAPRVDPAMLLPEGLGKATRFVVRHTKVDVKHAREVDEMIAALAPAQRAQVEERAKEFAALFVAFLMAAAGRHDAAAA